MRVWVWVWVKVRVRVGFRGGECGVGYLAPRRGEHDVAALGALVLVRALVKVRVRARVRVIGL